MVVVLHVAHLQIVRRADVVVGPQDQAGSFAAEKPLDRLDFLRSGLLLRDQVVETEHQQRVRVREDPLVERQPVPALVHPLEHRHGVSGRLADEFLERHERLKEQLQRSGDPLLEQERVGILR